MRMCTFVAAIVIGNAGAALGQPIEDEALRGMLLTRATQWQAMQAQGTLNMESATALNQEFVAQLDLASLTVDQIDMLAQQSAFVGITDLSGVMATLDRVSAEETALGARAALLELQLSQAGAPDAAAAMAMLEHPGTSELMRTESGATLMQLAGMTIGEMSDEQRASIYSFLNALPDDASNATLAYSQVVVSALAETVQKEQLEAHQASVAHLSTLASQRLTTETDARARQGLERLVQFLDGSFAQGKLIGAPMPKLDIVWSSDESLSSFDDLRGKVIVLDFWATWCGPCISSFPNVRHLQEHYEGHEVAIVGVTSVQGFVTNGPDGQVRCDGDEAKEFAETQRFMAHRDMAWPVVFTKQDVFNPAYGVSGIPHVTIIDTKGVVRASGLHPASPLEAKSAIIDGLLEEAGLSVPKTPEDG